MMNQALTDSFAVFFFISSLNWNIYDDDFSVPSSRPRSLCLSPFTGTVRALSIIFTTHQSDAQ